VAAALGCLIVGSAGARAGDRDAFDATGAALTVAPRPASQAETCVAPPDARPPDPRCGETLDGRPEARESAWWAVPRALLMPPRLIADLVLWPAVAAVEPIEHHHVIAHMESWLTSDDRMIGLRPQLRYATKFLPVVGFEFFHRRSPILSLDAHLLSGGPAVVIAEAELRGPAWSGLSLVATYRRRNDTLFAGTGPNSEAELSAAGHDIARYVSKIWAAGLGWAKPLIGPIVLDLRGALENRNYGASSVRGGPSVAEAFPATAAECAAVGLMPPCADAAELPGFYTGVSVSQGGAGLRVDTLGRARDAGGFRLAVDTTFHEGLGAGAGRWLTHRAETVVAFGGADRVFLLRGWAAAVQSLADTPIPFDQLVMTAGTFGMRGFPEGRFRGQSGLVGSAEYRYYILAALDASLFVDVGTVAGPWFSDIQWDRWFPSFGLGFRFVPWRGPHWEALPTTGFQVAYAPDGGMRLILGLAAF
jgi:hypothetical protein